MCSFLLSIGGSETQGLSILAEYFHKRHSSDFDSVCSRLGFTQTKQLSVNETVALQEYSSITHCQRRSIHSILISLLGFSVLSPNHAVEEYKNPYLNEFILSYYNEMPFRYVSIEKALINCLRQLRDTFFLSKIGKDVGILGPVAAYVLHGDTGDRKYKQLISFNFRNEDNHSFFTEIGWYEGSESYETLSNTFLTFHNEEIGKLNKLSLLWIKLPNRALFTLIPRFSSMLDLSYLYNEEKDSVIGVSFGSQRCIFDQQAVINVAQELPNCEATVLPFIPFLCGDLCYQCTLQGREDTVTRSAVIVSLLVETLRLKHMLEMNLQQIPSSLTQK